MYKKLKFVLLGDFMERIRIKDLEYDKVSKISGFVEKLKDTKYMVFVILRDISGETQVSIDKATQSEMASEVLKAIEGSVVSFWGTLKKSEFVKKYGCEFLPEKLHIESIAEPSPITEEANIDQKINYRWLDLRTKKNTLIFEVQTCLVNSFREYLLKKDFLEIHTPKLIGTASESGSDVFELKYFDRKAYLAQSPQFYKQMAMAAGFDRIFEVGPVFRAEKSYTNKHATEFTGFDLELSYIDDFYDVVKVEEEMLVYALKNVKEKYGDKIKELYGLDVVVPDKAFPIMKLADVYKELESRYGYKVPESELGDLTTEAEKLCKNLSQDMFGSEFLVVTDYSAEKRAFYHMRKNGVPQGYDLIWKGCEITTGAQREHRFNELRAQADEKGLAKDVEFYMQFFKNGCPPHGGFGLGVDRLTMILLGLSIKEVMFIFRGPNRLNP